MPVVGEDKIRFRHDGAVHEFVVIRIDREHVEPVMRFDVEDLAMEP